MTSDLGLSAVALPVLEELLVCVEQRRVEPPLTATGLRAAGFGAAAPLLVGALAGLDAPGASAVLRVAIAERLYRAPPRVRLVWTGPEGRTSTARDTAQVVRALFESAERTVIVAGYAFDEPEIVRPLFRAMAERGVRAQMFLDIEDERKAPTLAEGDAYATEAVDAFFRDVWTFGSPKPEVYWDPRTAVKGPPWASLHAKCVVVDDARTLITSANFTRRGQTRNVEAGVLVEDGAFAGELAAQWRQLVGEGLVRRYLG